jgi:hypothetical protein
MKNLKLTLAACAAILAASAHAQSTGITLTDGPSSKLVNKTYSNYVPKAEEKIEIKIDSTTKAEPAEKTTSDSKEKPQVNLYCEGKLKVFNLIKDSKEPEMGKERSHDIYVSVINQKTFKSYNDKGNAVQIRFEDAKECLSVDEGALCYRYATNPNGKQMDTKDFLDVNRYTGKLYYAHERTFPQALKRNDQLLSGVRLEYRAQCGKADEATAPAPEKQ